MWNWDYNLYLGDNSENDHIGFVTDTSFFIIAEGQDVDEETFHGALESLKQNIISEKPQHLHDFTDLLSEGFEALGKNLKSFVGALIVGDVMYFASRGGGEVYVSRGGQTAKLIHDDQTSSGFVKVGDTFLLANTTFTSQIAEDRLRTLMFNNTPLEIVEVLTPELKSKNDTGMFGLFLQAKKKVEAISNTEEIDDEELQEDEPEEEVDPMPDMPEASMPASLPMSAPMSTTFNSQPTRRLPQLPRIFQNFQAGSPMSKKITLGIVVTLVVVLGWSVLSGNARRQQAAFEKTIDAQKTTIEGKLSEAEELAGLNTQKSLQLIDESRSIVSQLQQDAEKKNMKSATIAQLSDEIDKAEAKIKNKENGQAEEFYDLALIDTSAESTRMYLDDSEITLLDSKNRKVYVLSAAEKSVDTYTPKSGNTAQFVAMHQGVPYMLGDAFGIMKLPEKAKQEELVKKDDAWGDIVDFWMYSGNMYLLDAGTPQIYKYLVAEGGAYSEKKNYLSDGQAGELNGATAMAIDSSIYVVVGEKVIKYTSGAKVAFNVAIPDESDITFEDIYTSRDVDEVYLLDKDSQRIFVTDKDGTFKKQISAGILKNADDFVVTPDQGILVLAGNKLYKVKK